MRKLSLRWTVALVCGACLIATATSALAAPKGAKAIFDSGSGGTIGMSSNATRPAPTPMAAADPAPVVDRYVGISYQILAIENDGQMRAVSNSRVFRSGDRVKILARTNRPGYLTVANIGTSGRMTILFSEYVDANRLTEIPPNSNLRFDNNPGTENILLMLSNEPSPFAPPSSGNQVVTAPPPPAYPAQAAAPAYPAPPTAAYTPPPAAPTYQPPPAAPAYPTQAAAPYPPPPMMPVEAQAPVMPDASAPPIYPPMPPGEASANLVASLEGAKSLKAKGAKDLMIEDRMESSYAVVSSRQGYRAVKGGAKDLIVESSADGVNYGVVPVSAVAGGGILTLEIKLKHR